MTMNESILGKCNMEVPDPLAPTQGVVPEVYANAIRERRAREEQITKDFKEAEDNLEEFKKETQRTEIDVKGTPEMKKMHLDESLFEESERPDKEALRISTDIRDFMENNDDILYNEEEYFTYEDRRALSKASSVLAAFAEMYADDHLTEATVIEERPTVVYKSKRGPLADIIMKELGRGEIVYKLGNAGKYNPTNGPSLNVDEESIGIGDDENGQYISAWIPESKKEAAVKIAQKYNKKYKLGRSKYVSGDKDYIRIYISEEDWDGNYTDPNVPTLASVK